MYLYGLQIDANDRLPDAEIQKDANGHGQYLLDGLIIRDADGNRVQGKVTGMDMPKLPDGGLPEMDAMGVFITYHLEYSLTKPPTHLGFQQHFGGDSMPIPSEMDLTVTREGLPSEPPFQLSGEGNVETIPIDWSETAKPGNMDEAREAIEAARAKEEMGISSYAATYSFFYIQDEEVRLEILMPLVTLDTFLQVPRANKDFIDPAEQTAAHDALARFFTSQNLVKIDGLPVKPNLERLDFYGVDFTDFAMRPAPRKLSAWTARVGAILTYPAKGTPRRVDLKWTLLNDSVLGARIIIYAYDKGSRVNFFPSQADYTWINPGTPQLPKVEAVQAGKSIAGDASRAAVAETLLRNIYRAFDYRNESDIYDALAQSVDGDLLTDLYLKIKQSLIVQQQGGAVARVKSVRVTASQPMPAANTASGNAFDEQVTWRVEGTVEHWGHIHTRINEYTAELGIGAHDGAWKITSMNVTRQGQVSSSVTVRKL